MIKDKIKDLIDNAPSSSGVYCFRGENDAVLYVGKAKNLKKRLLNYTVANRLSARISRMVFLAHNVEITQTANELEALLLEHNMIKKLEPKFNILLRDDKTFALIALDKKHPFGAIKKHRGMKDEDHQYFGPFASGGDVNRVIDVLKKSFLLRSCSDAEFKLRRRPCLEYQIKKCSGPCVGLIEEPEYKKLMQMAIDFLSGKSSQVQMQLAHKMQKLSEAQNYEEAALVRDKIKSLSSIQAKQNVNLSSAENIDLINLVASCNYFCVYISFYRGGNNYGSKPYFYKVEDDFLAEEFLAKFLGQFYLEHKPAEEILLNLEIEDVDLMGDFLSKILGKKVQIKNPKQGDKHTLIKDQEVIAKEVLEHHIKQVLQEKEILSELKNIFNLEKIPQRIEVYDNSHTGTQNAVGAMIVAGVEGFIKNAYRKFNLGKEGFATGNDDTAMLREVLLRRFQTKAAPQEMPREINLPDLVIIDGGIGQFNAAKDVFASLNLQVPFICMAKGEKRNAGEETYFFNNHDPIKLTKNSPLAFYLQRLRDEAHRFAITTHRAKRAKNFVKSEIDSVKGVGAKRKKALLHHFGSVEKIKAASLEDLMRVEGVSKKMAQLIFSQVKNG